MIVKFLEDAEPSGSAHPHKLEFEEARELAKSPPHRGRLIVFRKNQIDYPEPQLVLEQPTQTEQAQNESTLPLQNVEEVELRKSFRIRRPAISIDYVVYLKESVFDVGPKDDPSMFSHAMSGDNSTLWYNAMK
jgi:hypothetical protein